MVALELPVSLVPCCLSINLVNLAVLNVFVIILFYSILDIKNFSILEIDHLYEVRYAVLV